MPAARPKQGHAEVTPRARIRDAAIRCFAAADPTTTGVRTVAAEAGVSAGLVIHHFGSKANLRAECDQHVASLIAKQTTAVIDTGGFDPIGGLRTASTDLPIARYLARTLQGGSTHVADLVDELVADAVDNLKRAEQAGLVSKSEYPRERAAILTIWALGALALHEHLDRLIGVDITSTDATDPVAGEAYVGAVVEILSGIFTDAAPFAAETAADEL